MRVLRTVPCPHSGQENPNNSLVFIVCLLRICICLVGCEVKVELTGGASEDFPDRVKRSPMGITAQYHVFHPVDGLPELVSLSLMNSGGRKDTMHQILFIEVAVLNEVPNLARISVPPPCDQLLDLSERHAWPSWMASSDMLLIFQIICYLFNVYSSYFL